VICKIILIGFSLILVNILPGQVFYENSEASFELNETKEYYQVKCSLNRNIQGSRSLQLVLNRNRLKAVDLVGSYIIFKQLDFDFVPKDELFEAFVNYSNLSYESNVENFSGSNWETCDNMRCVNFECKKSDFVIGNTSVTADIDLAKMLMLNFRSHKSIKNACLLNESNSLNLGQQIDVELFTLRGNVKLNDKTSELLKLNPQTQLESSLFGNDSIMNTAVKNVLSEKNVFCNYGNLMLSKILFTCIGSSEKDSIYKNMLKQLASCNGIWCYIQWFVASKIDLADFPGFDEATVFDVIGFYPGALNIYGMRITSPGEHYHLASNAFGENNMEYALELLQNEINMNGVSPQALNLIGASYRILNQPDKALPYLILAFYIDMNTPYLAGNTCLCLNALGFDGMAEISDYFIKLSTIDPWSKEQIISLVKK